MFNTSLIIKKTIYLIICIIKLPLKWYIELITETDGQVYLDDQSGCELNIGCFVVELTMVMEAFSSANSPWKKTVTNNVYGKVPDSKVHVANVGPTWVLSAPGGPHVDPMNFAIRVGNWWCRSLNHKVVCPNTPFSKLFPLPADELSFHKPCRLGKKTHKKTCTKNHFAQDWSTYFHC